MSKILNYLLSHQNDIEETLLKLVHAESPSDSKILVDRCGEVLRGEFQRLVPGTVERITQNVIGDQYVFTYSEGQDQVLILGHFDTVWDEGALPVKVHDGKLWGPGAFDMKGGLTIVLWALKAISDLGYESRRRVVFLATTDEETGSHYSREIIEQKAKNSVCVLVPESSIPPDGDVKTARKGIANFTLKVHGIPSHAGHDPRAGVSAIDELVAQIIQLQKLNDFEAGLSINVGVIHGGTRSNVKAEYAEAEIDVRFVTKEQADLVTATFQQMAPTISGATLEVSGGINRYPMERTARVVELYEMVRTIASLHGYDLKEGMSGGGSDGNFTAALGVPTIDGLGPVGDGAHARNEHVILHNLPYRAALLAELLLELIQ